MLPYPPGCAATIGIIYAGTSVQQLRFGRHLEIVRGLNEPPSVRGADIIVPGLAGRITRNRINDIVSIELRGIITNDPTATTTSLASFRSNVLAMQTLFDPTRAVAALALGLEGGQTATIQARPLNMVWVEDIQSLLAKLSVELEGYGTWVYS